MPKERVPDTNRIGGWFGLRARQVIGKLKDLCPSGIGPWFYKPWPNQYIDCYPGSPKHGECGMHRTIIYAGVQTFEG